MECGVTTAPLAVTSQELSMHCTSVRILQAAVKIALWPLSALF